jgi:hypothetical protein
MSAIPRRCHEKIPERRFPGHLNQKAAAWLPFGLWCFMPLPAFNQEAFPEQKKTRCILHFNSSAPYDQSLTFRGGL